jgi:hypothetical protein
MAVLQIQLGYGIPKRMQVSHRFELWVPSSRGSVARVFRCGTDLQQFVRPMRQLCRLETTIFNGRAAEVASRTHRARLLRRRDDHNGMDQRSLIY